MKILNVNMSLDPVTGGGTAERTLQVSRHMTKSGIPCSVLTTDVGLNSEQTSSLNDLNVIALPNLIKRFYFPKYSFRFLKRFVAGFDVVHLMNHWTAINALVYRVCKYLNKPYVVCPAGALPLYGRSRHIKRLYNWIIGKSIIRDADGHVAIATNEINHYRAYGIGPDRISVIPNGINAEDFQSDDVNGFRNKYGLGDTPYILFIGRLNAIKGPDLLLQAFGNLKDRLQDLHLVFVGPDGGMLAELKQMVVEFGVNERVHFLGYLGGFDKSQAYHAAKLLAIPSRQEAMSIVVLEAGITGTPVLITDQCGFDEIYKINGGQVVSASVVGLQNGLVDMLSYPEQLKTMEANLKKYVEDHYTWDETINKYLNLYRKILDIE